MVDGLRLDEWALDSREIIDAWLLAHRALLFRGFDVPGERSFRHFVERASASGQLMDYRDRSSPRSTVEDRIYTSTDYPPEHPIFLHNEGTYWIRWPLRISFGCLAAPSSGGETPIADVRRVYDRIDPAIREEFVEKKVRYVRNYNEGFGLTWQDAFQTTDPEVVDAYCDRNRITATWRPSGRLRTTQVREAVATHPITGEPVWFNHATFFHVSTLEPVIRDGLLREFEQEELPYNTYYGDGSPIDPKVLAHLRDCYRAEKRMFQWRTGDVLLLDNMSIAHGRESYIGSRRIIVGMADPSS